jgi:hypothetical protein
MMLMIHFTLSIHAQNPTYLCELRNDVQVSGKIYEFDIYLLRTGTTPFEYAAGQFGILINPQIKNGGTLTASVVSGSANPVLIGTNQNPTNITFTDAANCIKIAGRVPPGAGNGAIISNIAPGTKVCRVRLTNTASFGNYSPNLAWTTTTIYPTQINAYVGGLNVAITVASSQTTGNLVNQTLPVELISFEGDCNMNDVNLQWATASETNNDYFTIQKSRDIYDFENVSDVPGAGNSNSNIYYSYTVDPYENGITYYRLKQTDFDGKYSYSNIISTDCSDHSNLSDSYNLITTGEKKITIQVHMNSTSAAIIKVYDISGKEITTILNEANLGSGDHTYTYDFISPGMFVIKAVIGNNTHVNKIIFI